MQNRQAKVTVVPSAASLFFFFNDTATTEIYTLSLHDALPICLDGFLVTAAVNVTYLTGFTGDSSYFAALPKHDTLISDTRFEEQVKEECPDLDAVIRGHNKTTLEAAAEVLTKAGARNVGVEGNRITLGELEALKALAPKVTFVPVNGVVEAQRAVKDPGEIERIREAVRVAERGFRMFTATLHESDSEKDMVDALEAFGINVEAAHHEVAVGQHEIDFHYDNVLTTADNVSTCRFIVKNVALNNNLHATFMPKPIFGVNGSGMHTHQSLFKDGVNAFFDERTDIQLSQTCLHYVGGLLQHAKGFCAITNPLVNSYKRLVPGYEAPTAIAWSERNRSPLIRLPAARGAHTRVELRMPDPSCNPYLALAAILGSGLDGIDRKLDPGPPVNKNIYKMSHRERRHLRIDELPGNQIGRAHV